MVLAKCNLCQGDNLSHYRGDERMILCQSCGLVFLAPDLVPQDLDSYYQDNIFYAENAGNPLLVERMRKTARFYLDIINNFIKFEAGQSFVDIGSNYGVLVEEAKKKGFKAIGLEKNRSLIEGSRARGLEIFDKNLGDLVVSPSLDIVTAMHVLEHIEQPHPFVQEVFKSLLPGGLFFVGVPNLNSFLSQKDGTAWRYVALEHINYFSPKTLVSLLVAEGFEILGFRRDGTNLEGLSIKKLLHYLFGSALKRDRFQPKDLKARNVEAVGKKSLVRLIFKKMIVWLIKVLRREDFIVVIAKKLAK